MGIVASTLGGCAQGAGRIQTDGGSALDAGVSDAGDAATDAGADSGVVGEGTICMSCVSHSECAAGHSCVELSGGGGACLPSCATESEEDECPTGFSCVEVPDALDSGAVCSPGSNPCCVDEDADTYGVGLGCTYVDCDDTVAERHVGAPEVCDGIDNDCNDVVDDADSSDLCPELVNIVSICDPVERLCTGTECVEGYGDCSTEEAGCETALTTATDCGACGTPCAAEGATTSCDTGTCEITGCMDGFANCDGMIDTGCEVDLATPPTTCAEATDVGSEDGDAACNLILGCPDYTRWDSFGSHSGTGSAWFKARATEGSECSASIEHRVQLTVPAGTNYDLFVYRSCGGAAAWSSTNAAGLMEEVQPDHSDGLLSDDDFDYWVEVRYRSGVVCDQWTLSFEGHAC